MTDAGGLFVKVSAVVDKTSFEESHKSVDGLDVSFNKLVGTVRNAGVVLAAMKGVKALSGIGELESQSYKTSVALGITTDAFDLWSASAKIAGVNADALFASMNKVGNVLKNLSIDGEGANELAKALGINLGLGIEDLKENGEWLSADKAFEVILKKAEKLKADGMELSEIYLRLQKAVGKESADFFAELQREGVTLEEFQRGAANKVYTDSGSNQKAQDFAKEMRELTTTLKSMKSLLGSEVGGVVTPYIEKINDFLDSNKSTIVGGIKTISEKTDKVIATGIDKFTTWWDTHGDEVLELLGTIAAMTMAITTKTLKIKDSKAAQIIGGYFSDATSGAFTGFTNVLKTALEGGDLAGAVLEWIDDSTFRPIANAVDKARNGNGNVKKTQDGILRPDGTLTQVAPDDWVFAARNVSDLARAFIPQNYTSVQGGTEISIVQNFTINGGSDMPQILRQQAYKGTQEGLLEVMNQSSRRLQLMSGTR